MVQLNTTYDSTLKEKVFILKGEEAQARTTDTLLNIVEYADSYNHIRAFRLGFEIEVLRDIDESYIVLYDNDDVLLTLPISNNRASVDYSGFDEVVSYDATSKKIVIGSSLNYDSGIWFSYDVEHDFYVKFMGNKKCLKSQSKIEKFFKDTPEAYSSSLEFVNPTTTQPYGSTVSLPLKLNTSEYVSSDSKVVKVYVDDALKTTVNLTPNTQSNINLTSLSEGLHTVRCYFEGDEEYVACSVELTISVGYFFELVRCDSPAVYSQQAVSDKYNILQYKLCDYFNNGVSGKSVTVWIGNNNISATTNSDGLITVNMTTYVNVTGTTSVFAVHEYNNDYDVVSDEITVTTWNGTFTISSDMGSIIASGVSTGITVQLSDNVSNVPVLMNVTDDILYTDSQGSVTLQYTGDGSGTDYIRADIGMLSQSITLIDAFQYWNNAQNIQYNPYYSLSEATLTRQSNGWLLKPNNVMTDSSITFVSYHLSYDHCLEFTVVSASKPTSYDYAQSIIGGVNYNQLKAEDKIRVEYDATNSKSILYVNNTKIGENTNVNPRKFVFYMDVVIDKVILRRLP